MAICLNFELIKVRGTIAEYRFGECLKELDGVFEIDLSSLINGDTPLDTPIFDVVRLKNKKQSQAAANRVFSIIHSYFLEHKEYPRKGDYYA
ncbi:hypothetical protein [Paenibacillus sp. JDR-2]|uniref:hypothetical protein n=1 Tax=Paenibacillus sp. (strain JDR-2) TaxID=324057 RepID=UPI0001665C59|nr:hypothetical protein [Paenibacillus sp. JDR-2]ACT03213.1 hypothetical protein Pjdr2_4599 [Paenibacillus sp. JDR-2]